MAPDPPKTEPAMAAGVPVNPDPLAVPNDKPSVADAKRRFIEAMHQVDLLEPLRGHPYVVVGAAATAGAVLGGSGKVVLGISGIVNALARMAKPLGGIVAQLAAAKFAAHTAVKETESSEAKASAVANEPAEANI